MECFRFHPKIDNFNVRDKSAMQGQNLTEGGALGTYWVHTQLAPFVHTQSQVLSQIQLHGAIPQNNGTVIIRYLTEKIDLIITSTEGDGTRVIAHFHLRYEDSRAVYSTFVHHYFNFANEPTQRMEMLRKARGNMPKLCTPSLTDKD